MGVNIRMGVNLSLLWGCLLIGSIISVIVHICTKNLKRTLSLSGNYYTVIRDYFAVTILIFGVEILLRLGYSVQLPILVDTITALAVLFYAVRVNAVIADVSGLPDSTKEHIASEIHASFFSLWADHIRNPMFVTNTSGKCIFYNTAYSDLTGYNKQELLGTAWERIIMPEDLPSVREKWAAFASGGDRFYNMSNRCVHRDGTIIHVLARAFKTNRGIYIGVYEVVEV